MDNDEIQTIKEELIEIKKITRRTQQYFLWFLVITALSVLLPILGLIFYIPKFISIYSTLI